jgi:hypothetical protein
MTASTLLFRDAAGSAMSSNGDLFRHDPLPIYLKNRDQLILNLVGHIDSISELDQRAAEILDGAVITPVLMHRRRTTIVTSRSTEGLEVKVTVPLGGYTRLLHHPPARWTRPGPYGVLETTGDPVFGVSEPRLRLGHRFKEAVSPVQVGEWVRNEIDRIQQALDLQDPVIEEYNVRVRALVQGWLAARRSVLEAAAAPEHREGDV